MSEVYKLGSYYAYETPDFALFVDVEAPALLLNFRDKIGVRITPSGHWVIFEFLTPVSYFQTKTYERPYDLVQQIADSLPTDFRTIIRAVKDWLEKKGRGYFFGQYREIVEALSRLSQ